MLFTFLNMNEKTRFSTLIFQLIDFNEFLFKKIFLFCFQERDVCDEVVASLVHGYLVDQGHREIADGLSLERVCDVDLGGLSFRTSWTRMIGIAETRGKLKEDSRLKC